MKKAKKIIAGILCLTAAAAAIPLTSIVSADEITVELDGKVIDFDVEPQLIDGRTMVPLRKIFEEIGALVKWDEDTQTVAARKSSKTVTLQIDSADLSIDRGSTDENGEAEVETVTLEVPAQLISGRTLVPARAVSEAFGLAVDWDEKAQRVIITSDGGSDDSWKQNTAEINLSEMTSSGEGVSLEGSKILITSGGDYTLTGTLDGGSITVSTDERVKLRLSGASITSEGEPCIYAESTDKLYITLTENTENTLISKSCEDGAIYSKKKLEIKGSGSLSAVSEKGHAIKVSDNLTIENGNMALSAAKDGIHVSSTLEMSGGDVSITADGDGIDSDSIVIISGGALNIETKGVPIIEETEDTRQARPEEQSTEVEFESSSKGIKAEWMMSITGGEITVNSASHAVHCGDVIEISGGSLTLASEYEKGISAHGDLTVSGENTAIDVQKSTEGLESKDTLTINDGKIKIIASDDGINATGGKSGEMLMPGGFGGGRRNDNGTERTENAGGNEDSQADRQPNGASGRGGHREMRGQKPAEQSGEGENAFVPPQNRSEITSDEQAAPPEPPQGDNTVPPDIPQNGDNMPSDKPQGGMTPPDMAQSGGMTPPDIPQNGGMTPPDMPQDGDKTPPDMPQNGREPNSFGGFGGNMGENNSNCLIINGGDIEIYAEDDCIDSNGNLIINGGTVKAVKVNGSFTGPNSVLDADGKVSIGAQASVIAAGSGGTQSSLDISGNAITIYSTEKHSSGDKVTVSDKNGKALAEYTPNGEYSAVLIILPELKSNETYTVTLGEERFEATLSEGNTVVGEQQGHTDFRGGGRHS